MTFLREVLFWLDAATWRYWALAWSSLGWCSMLAWRASVTRQAVGWRGNVAFGLSVIFTLAAFRWPSWLYPLDLNPDEAQIVSGALTLERLHVFWKYIDSTTHGPLCEIGLLLASWVGAPFNYITARVVAAGMQAGTLLAVWLTLRPFTSERVARLSILPGLAFWSFVSWDDLVHYSSELPGILLVALATCGLANALSKLANEHSARVECLGSGLCLGAVPFGKLQLVPHALAIVLTAVVIGWQVQRPGPARRAHLAAFVIGGLAPALGVGAYLYAYGLWGQFWGTYVQSAIAFLDIGPHRFAHMPGRFFHFSATAPAFAWFFWGCLGFALLYLRGTHRGALRAGVLAAWFLVAAAYFCVIRPTRESAHYLQLLIAPVTLLAGFTLARAVAERVPESSASRPSTGTVFLCFCLLALGPQIYERVSTANRFAGHAREYLEQPPSAAARFILQRANSDDRLAMWGWEPHLLVEVQMPHGTREAQSGNQLMEWSMKTFFVQRYLFDIQRWKPAWFVDAVGPGAFIFDNRAAAGHEALPALKSFIAENYEFLAEIENKRIYRRRP